MSKKEGTEKENIKEQWVTERNKKYPESWHPVPAVT